MQPRAVGQPRIDHRARVVEPLAAGRGEPHRERAQPLRIAEVDRPALEPARRGPPRPRPAR